MVFNLISTLRPRHEKTCLQGLGTTKADCADALLETTKTGFVALRPTCSNKCTISELLNLLNLKLNILKAKSNFTL